METKDIVMTEELRAKLKAKGMLGFTTETSFKYVPKFYRDAKNDIPKAAWPLYTLKSKDGIELAEAEDGVGYVNLDSKDRQYVIQSGTQRVETLQRGILSIKNQIMEDGRVFSYDTKKMELITVQDGIPTTRTNVGIKDVIKLLPSALQVDLQNAILERSQLTSEELLGLE